MSDPRLHKLRKTFDFFEQWEEEAKEFKKFGKMLLSKQCRDDLASTILGFIALCAHHIPQYGTCIVPGRTNSDVVENT